MVKRSIAVQIAVPDNPTGGRGPLKGPWSRGAVALATVAMLAVNVVATYLVLTKPSPGHNDFLSRWEGARSYWVDGLDPYGDEASLNIQVRIYGRPVVKGEDPGLFVYPFYTVFLLWPLVHLDYAWASAIWMVFLEVCLIAALGLLLDQFGWRPTPLWFAGLAVWGLFSYSSVRGLMLGQLSHLVYFLQVLTIWALAKRLEVVAGVALALSTVKPQMGYLLVPFLLLWALRTRRPRFAFSFAAILGILSATSFMLQPLWLEHWVRQVAVYPSYTPVSGPLWALVRLPRLLSSDVAETWTFALPSEVPLEWTLSVLLHGFLLWAWFDVLVCNRRERFTWTLVATLIVSLYAPRTPTPHFVVATVPLVFYLREWIKAQHNGRRFAVVALLLGVFVAQWLHFALTVNGNYEHPTLLLLVPISMSALLWVTRRQWWRDTSDAFLRDRPTPARLPQEAL
jgi:hypothetical protein